MLELYDSAIRMPRSSVLVMCLFLSAPVLADTITFDQATPGTLPTGWLAGVTGGGSPKWTVEADVSAPSKPNVLKQSGSGDFPWCVRGKTLLTDGFVEAKFKLLAGKEDRAGGVIWRWKDGDNYYVARANALENNVSLYYIAGGQRSAIFYQDAPVAANVWHTLRAEFSGEQIKVVLDGKTVITEKDAHIGGAGSAGVWTKADSVTVFDDFSFGEVLSR